jgi:hypothetical protein
MNKTINYLKTLPENSGQKVKIKHDQTREFYFKWFLNDKTIDLQPCDNIDIISVPKGLWHIIELVM